MEDDDFEHLEDLFAAEEDQAWPKAHEALEASNAMAHVITRWDDSPIAYIRGSTKADAPVMRGYLVDEILVPLAKEVLCALDAVWGTDGDETTTAAPPARSPTTSPSP